MSYRSIVYSEVPDASSIIVDYEAPSRNMDSELIACPKKHATTKARLSSTNNIQELLQCPLCCNPMYPPIFQCPKGHTICSKCKPKVNNQCPSCHHELDNIRCLALEKVAKMLDFPCKYLFLGCQEIAPYYEKLEHEFHCRFRPYNCPYAGSECSVTGDIGTLIAHLSKDHKIDMHVGSAFNHRYVKSNPFEIENATWMLTVFNCFGNYFCLHFESFLLGNAPVYMAFIRYMGEADEANRYGYSLEVGGNGRRQVWQGVPRSIRDSHHDVREIADGLVIPRRLALSFSGGNQMELKLRVTGRIWEEH